MSAPRMISIALIDAGNRLRVLDPTWVDVLSDELASDGLLEPIRVVPRGERFLLVSGARRLAAATALGWKEIEARIASVETGADETSALLAEIKADMMRGELTALEHAVYVAAWCGIYRQAQGPRKRGPKPAMPQDDAGLEEFSANLALNWTDAAQKALGIARRGIFRSLKIDGIARDLRDRIALHPVATKQSELLMLAEEGEARQAAIVDMLTAEPARADSVSSAIMLLSGTATAAPKAVYERFQERFVAWKPADRRAFLLLNMAAFEELQAELRSAPKTKAAA